MFDERTGGGKVDMAHGEEQDPMEGDRSCRVCGKYHDRSAWGYQVCKARLNYQVNGFASASAAERALWAERDLREEQDRRDRRDSFNVSARLAHEKLDRLEALEHPKLKSKVRHWRLQMEMYEMQRASTQDGWIEWTGDLSAMLLFTQIDLAAELMLGSSEELVG
jgi:hypothetical protein